jgi:hypothetical protein
LIANIVAGLDVVSETGEYLHCLVVELKLCGAARSGKECDLSIFKAALEQAHGGEDSVGAIAALILQELLEGVGVMVCVPDRSGLLDHRRYTRFPDCVHEVTFVAAASCPFPSNRARNGHAGLKLV